MVYFGKFKGTNNYNFGMDKNYFETFVEIEENEYQKIMAKAVKEKKAFSADENGQPVLVEPKKSIEEISKIRRRIIELEQYLFSTDWYVLRSMDSGVSIPFEIKKKRQEARDEISKLKKDY